MNGRSIGAVALGVFSGGVVAWGLRSGLPPAATTTAMPEFIGAGFGGAIAALGLGRRWGAAALLTASIISLTVLIDDPKACRNSHQQYWAPGFSLVAAMLWGGAWFVERRLGRALPAFTAAMVALCLSGVSLSIADSTYKSALAKPGYARVWNIYHYYLGSKYFADVGYSELYAVTLRADDRAKAVGLPADQRLDLVRRTRDMHTYSVISRAAASASVPGVDDATLDALHHDLRGMLPHRGAEEWKDVMSDMGYNPAPAWPVVGQPLANLLSTEGWQLWTLAHLDVLGFALTVFSLWWAWGPRVAAMACLYVATVAFNRGRLLGGFLQYDWLCSLVVGMALYRKGWSASAGAVLSYAAMTRVFPGFFVFPALVALGVGLVRRTVLDRATLRFAVSFTAACAVWFVLSHTTGRGLQTWPEWVDAIRTHSTLHGTIGRARLGLGRLGAHTPTEEDLWHGVPRTSDMATAHERDARVLPWRVLGLLLVLVVALKRSKQDRMAWMLALVFVGVVTSRYYGSSWLLLLAMGLPAEGDAGKEQEGAGVLLAMGVLLVPAVFYATEDGSNLDEVYFKVNYWVAGVLVLAGLGWLIGDARRGLAEPEG